MSSETKEFVFFVFLSFILCLKTLPLLGVNEDFLNEWILTRVNIVITTCTLSAFLSNKAILIPLYILQIYLIIVPQTTNDVIGHIINFLAFIIASGSVFLSFLLPKLKILPQPLGKFAVGKVEYVWEKNIKVHVRVWYPADTDITKNTKLQSEYMDSEYHYHVAHHNGFPEFLISHLKDLMTNSYLACTVAAEKKRYPGNML